MVARAGVGLDNVDVPAATQAGVMVVNAPTSNIGSAAELAIALLLASARNIAPANSSLKGGAWKRSKYTGVELADKVVEATKKPNDFHFIYDVNESIPEKIEKITKEIYGGDGVDFTPAAKKQLKEIEELGFDKMPVCMAKTQYSLSDDATKIGRPTGFRITVKELRISAGAGFIVALTGNILTMPGLPKHPAAENMDIDVNGKITGLF